MYNNQKYLEFIENLGEGIWIIDAESSTTFVNSHMVEMLGYKSEEMIGKHLFNFMDDSAVESAKIILQRRAQGIRENIEFEFQHKNGNKVITALNSYPLIDNNGKYNGAIAAITDITHLKKQLQDLEQTEALFKGVLQSSPIAITIWDRELRNIYANPAAFDQIGRKKEVVPPRRHMREGLPNLPGFYVKWEKRVLDCISSGKANHYTDIDNIGGKFISSESNTTPISDSQGNIFAVAIVFRDVSKRKQLEQELLKKEKLSAIGKMLTHLSHEIKSPLASISMNIELLIRDLPLNNNQLKSFDIIKGEIERLENLLKDILFFSKEMTIKRVTFDIKDTIEEIRKLMEPVFRKKNIVFIDSVESKKITGDSEKLKSAIINLIENSVDAIETKGEIGIYSVDSETDFVRLLIKDTGCGIEPTDKLFDPFFTTKNEGSGLGLTIAKNIIEKHDGTLKLVSSKAGETIFEISLPIHEKTDE